MDDADEEVRVLAACEGCGAVYAAIELSNNGLQPIGSRTGCGSCGGKEFTPLTNVVEGTDAIEEDTDD